MNWSFIFLAAFLGIVFSGSFALLSWSFYKSDNDIVTSIEMAIMSMFVLVAFAYIIYEVITDK